MDPATTGIGAGLALYGGKDIVDKLLGPTAEYLGEEIKNSVAKKNENLKRIFSKSVDTLGEKINQSGQVPPRVLKQVWDEGRFIEDELTAQYFGGILASSRSEDGTDDRTLPYLDLVKSMSTYQIKFHHLFYTLARRYYFDSEYDCEKDEDRNKMRLFIPLSLCRELMGLSENRNTDSIFRHTILGLYRLGLIAQGYAYGKYEKDVLNFPEIEEPGIVSCISSAGIELYLLAHGYPDVEINQFLNPDIHLGEMDISAAELGKTFEIKNYRLNFLPHSF
ncbi:hypothetical protein HWN40_13250 [Methanolobus zinderi]|uniref:DUF4393 domain-containing protein n=1 Tax=Methanolobus zinderi TaxID=536044 RepID=A0A7D5EG62_9EURY|nr:hypothetical protein [Methanolobus zinderi]QLC51116.1 hypothetical protein HWN40_13250 [Methanolobus zinderi]